MLPTRSRGSIHAWCHAAPSPPLHQLQLCPPMESTIHCSLPPWLKGKNLFQDKHRFAIPNTSVLGLLTSEATLLRGDLTP